MSACVLVYLCHECLCTVAPVVSAGVTLLIDSWTNSKGEQMLGFAVVTDDRQVRERQSNAWEAIQRSRKRHLTRPMCDVGCVADVWVRSRGRDRWQRE